MEANIYILKKAIMCDYFLNTENCKYRKEGKLFVFLLTSSSKNNMENPKISRRERDRVVLLTFNIQVY